MTGDQSAVGLSQDELATVIAELHDHREMSFGEIAMCVPRRRNTIEELYEEHGGYGQ